MAWDKLRYCVVLIASVIWLASAAIGTEVNMTTGMMTNTGRTFIMFIVDSIKPYTCTRVRLFWWR